MRRPRTPLTFILLTACAQGAPEASEHDRQDIRAPIRDALPPGMGRLSLQGTHATEGSGVVKTCHGTLISRRRVVTAAHCFTGFGHEQMDYMTIFEQSFQAQHVRFHPRTWSDGAIGWTSLRDLSDLNHAFDVAIIDLPHAPDDVAQVKLWNPYDFEGVDLAGKKLEFGGHRPAPSLQPATGEETILRVEDRDGGYLIFADRSPSGLEPGDSGGGATVLLTSSMPGSRTLNAGVPCAAPAPQVGERVLVGVNAAMGSEDIFTAVYTDEIASWLAAGAFDSDGDGVCEEIDICPQHYDPEQRNCNAFAEMDPRWGSGVVLGDACDPTPCAETQTYDTDFVPGPEDNDLLVTHGRTIKDIIGVAGVIKEGDTANTIPTIYFCVCRDAKGAPISDPAICEAAPFYCLRDPVRMSGGTKIEVGHGNYPAENETYWLKITVSPARADRGTIAIAHPSAAQPFTWEYEADYADWRARGLVHALVQDPRFPPGTDLGGMLWVRSTSSLGATEHGLPSSVGECSVSPERDNCTIADSFVDGVAPDARVTLTQDIRVPRHRPNPWWSGCPMCGPQQVLMRGDIVSNPARFVTIDDSMRTTRWTDERAIDVSDVLTQELKIAITSGTYVFVPGSEPPSVLESAAPRATMLSLDGTTMLGNVTMSRNQFGVGRLRSVASGMAPRSGFASAYGRTSGTTYVIGGVSARGQVQADVFSYSAGRWSRVALRDSSQAPIDAKASAFSSRDGRVWIVDAAPRGGKVLRRVDPASGAVTSHAGLSVLSGLTDVWMTTLADGRVLIAGNTARGHRLAILDAVTSRAGSTVSVVGSLERTGTLAMGPDVSRTLVTVAKVGARDGGVAIIPEAVALSSLGAR